MERLSLSHRQRRKLALARTVDCHLSTVAVRTLSIRSPYEYPYVRRSHKSRGVLLLTSAQRGGVTKRDYVLPTEFVAISVDLQLTWGV